MVKTTIALENALYKKLAKEALERYGKTRSLSRLINDKLKLAELQRSKSISEKIDESFGIWKMKETGAGFARKLRRQSERRLTRLGI